jgi:hypothetical protein
MTIRERIAEETREAKTRVDLDRIWHRDNKAFPKSLMAEFPGKFDEILYEWEGRKLAIRREV